MTHWSSCNTTTLDGAPLLIFFRFSRPEYRNLFDPSDRPTAPNQWDEHVELVRDWATMFNQNVPDLEGSVPSTGFGLPQAWPVRTALVTTPWHQSPPGNGVDPAYHISLHPSKDYWFRSPRFHGFWGTVHIFGYGTAAIPGRPGDPARGMYSMWAPGAQRLPRQRRWDTPEELRQIRDCIRRHRLYTGKAPSRDTTYGGWLPPPPPPVPGKVPAAAKRPLVPVGQIPLPLDASGNIVWATDPQYPCPPAAIDTVQQWAVDRIEGSVLIGAPDVNEELAGVWYRVAWTGWPPDSSYYPAKDFKNCPAKITEFHSLFPESPGPPALIDNWHRAYMRGRVLSAVKKWEVGDMQPVEGMPSPPAPA